MGYDFYAHLIFLKLHSKQFTLIKKLKNIDHTILKYFRNSTTHDKLNIKILQLLLSKKNQQEYERICFFESACLSLSLSIFVFLLTGCYSPTLLYSYSCNMATIASSSMFLLLSYSFSSTASTRHSLSFRISSSASALLLSASAYAFLPLLLVIE